MKNVALNINTRNFIIELKLCRTSSLLTLLRLTNSLPRGIREWVSTATLKAVSETFELIIGTYSNLNTS